MREGLRSGLRYWSDTVRWSCAHARSQFTGGRYRTKYLVLFALGIVILNLPLLLLDPSRVGLLAVYLPMLWLDWRHRGAFLAPDIAFASLAEVPPSELVRLKAFQLAARRGSIEIIATDQRIAWGRRALRGGQTTLGMTGRTEISFSEISRVARTGSEIRIWTRTDTYSIRFYPLLANGSGAANDWFSYLRQVCPDADCVEQEPEPVRNSPLLKPAIAAVAGLVAGVPYVVFLAITLRDAGWL